LLLWEVLLATSISGLTSSAATTSGSTGLGQGIDVQQFVKLAVAGAQANITNLQDQQTTLNSQTTALQQITTDLNNLQNAAEALSDPLGALDAQVATSSNSGVLNATAASTASSGEHTVTVTNLATTSSYYTDPVASSNTPLSTGSFTIQVGPAGANTPVTINIDDTNNTLDGLAASINGQNDGVTASVITDANGARLALVSNTSGAPGDLTVSGNTTSLNFNKPVTGINASLVVDGVPISSTTNNVSGVINGVTLSLSAPSSTPVTVSVNPDTSQATTAINTFVSAYNTAIGDVNAQFAVNADGSANGPLEADSSLQEAQQSLLSAIAYSSTNGAVSNLASIGVNLNDDGTLSVDSGTLTAALSSNFSDVQNFLQATSTGFANNLSNTISGLTEPGSGILSLDASGIAQSSSDLTSQISDLQAALTVQEQNLTTIYAQVNDTLQELPLLEAQTASQLSSGS
jgi:flagellar hook-associated protein 2